MREMNIEDTGPVVTLMKRTLQLRDVLQGILIAYREIGIEVKSIHQISNKIDSYHRKANPGLIYEMIKEKLNLSDYTRDIERITAAYIPMRDYRFNVFFRNDIVPRLFAIKGNKVEVNMPGFETIRNFSPGIDEFLRIFNAQIHL